MGMKITSKGYNVPELEISKKLTELESIIGDRADCDALNKWSKVASIIHIKCHIDDRYSPIDRHIDDNFLLTRDAITGDLWASNTYQDDDGLHSVLIRLYDSGHLLFFRYYDYLVYEEGG